MGLDPAITAGAIISGAYFGDKSSPLSDSANLAAAAAGVDLYEHVRETLLTSAVGAGDRRSRSSSLLGQPGDFDATGEDGGDRGRVPHLAGAVPAARRWCSCWRCSALAALHHHLPRRPRRRRARRRSSRPERVIAFAGAGDLPDRLALLKGVWLALASGYTSTSGVRADGPARVPRRHGQHARHGLADRDRARLRRRGREGRRARPADHADHRSAPDPTARWWRRWSASIVATNVVTADQYIAIVLPGRMFQGAFAEARARAVVLSRAVGDTGARRPRR